MGKNNDEENNLILELLGMNELPQEQIDAIVDLAEKMLQEEAEIPVLKNVRKEESLQEYINTLRNICSHSSDDYRIEVEDSHRGAIIKIIDVFCPSMTILRDDMNDFREVIKACYYFCICPHLDGTIELNFHFDNMGKRIAQNSDKNQ